MDSENPESLISDSYCWCFLKFVKSEFEFKTKQSHLKFVFDI